MNQDVSWDQMVQDQGSDFIDFLNVENFNIEGLDFGEFEAGGQNGEGSVRSAAGDASDQLGGGAMLDMNGGWDSLQTDAMNANLAHASGNHVRPQQHQHPAASKHQNQHQQQQYGQIHTHMAVPPTPDSMEMHARPQYQGVTSQQARMMYEAYPRKQQEQMVFTPLVSPAVTPLDTHFHIPEYAVPGEYFSPLTSPAMPAQQVKQRSVYSSTSEGASPSDMEIDSNSPQAMTSSIAGNISSKGKKNSKVQKTSAARTVRQSPAMKPQQQKRKPPTSSSIAPKDVAEIMEGIAEGASSSRPGSANLRVPIQRRSESESASPEAMSEVLMPPPATPRSAPGYGNGRSPMLGPQQQQNQQKQGPVTPATLMRLQQQGSQSHSQQGSPVILPSHGQSTLVPLRPDLRVDTRAEEDLMTPTLSARDSGNGGGSTVTTPRTVAADPGVLSKSASATPAKGKKRNSSSHPSPALRPRISPSIKPLLPEGALSAEQSAMLLATKSNYQNILEGNKVPGVTYPNALSANLTSKRTSHKLAEQGRRNRMNTALQELASLLPNPSVETPTLAAAVKGENEGGQEGTKDATKDATENGNDGSKDPGGGKGGGGAAGKEAASKASTVEMAIDFIKALQIELGAVKDRLADAERKLGDDTAGSNTESADIAGLPNSTSKAADIPQTKKAKV